MTIATKWFNWAASGLDWRVTPWNACSPNLGQIRGWLDVETGIGDFLGCHLDRPIGGSSSPSVHSWGAATDWRYQAGKKEQAIELLIANSAELHVQQIHDYVGDRIWRAGRTPNISDARTLWWRKQNGQGDGMGEAWATYLHFETHHDGFFDTTPIAQRLSQQPQEPKVMDFNLLDGGSQLKVPDASPVRLVDTRIGLGASQQKVPANSKLEVTIPVTAASAIVNVTLVDPSAAGFARVWGVKPGDGSNVNVTAGEPARPSPTIVKVGTGGKINVDLVRTSAHVLVDLLGVLV